MGIALIVCTSIIVGLIALFAYWDRKVRREEEADRAMYATLEDF